MQINIILGLATAMSTTCICYFVVRKRQRAVTKRDGIKNPCDCGTRVEVLFDYEDGIASVHTEPNPSDIGELVEVFVDNEDGSESAPSGLNPSDNGELIEVLVEYGERLESAPELNPRGIGYSSEGLSAYEDGLESVPTDPSPNGNRSSVEPLKKDEDGLLDVEATHLIGPSNNEFGSVLRQCSPKASLNCSPKSGYTGKRYVPEFDDAFGRYGQHFRSMN
jgi:hypothetical protein